MPVFISYSRKDKDFADTLAVNLVKRKHHIWMDRWELNVGDSLIEKIQGALIGSAAILLILSRNSVQSAWCKKEINSGLMRELDERKTIILPCVIDDCEIPLFLREKLYADFRADPDEALEAVNRALATVSNPQQSLAERPDFHTDWSVDWKRIDHHRIIEFTFVDHGHGWPYVILSRCVFHCSKNLTTAFKQALEEDRPTGLICALLKKLVLRCLVWVETSLCGQPEVEFASK